VSPPGRNLLFSVVLSDAQDRLAHEALTITTGLAVAEGIEEATGVECDLKWPNDVLIEGAKVAGVLVETGRVARRRWCVIGIGINVGWAPEAESIRRPATCLLCHAGRTCDRTQILQAVLNRLDLWVQRVEAGALDMLRQAWLSRCGMLHRRLRLRSGNREYEGIVLDIHPLEGLVLAPDQGPRVLIPSSSATLLD
jgi:BirA family biotin operon repressor/biotin-[acetyl-CoA-carboxylase] ligase